MDEITSKISEIIKRANAGDTKALLEIDELTGAPAGTYASIVENFDATKVAAQMGSVECMEILGQSYYTGLYGVDKDPQQAVFWLEKASASSATATWFLGQIQANHFEDYALADKLMRRAIEMGLNNIPQEEIDIALSINSMLMKIKAQFDI